MSPLQSRARGGQGSGVNQDTRALPQETGQLAPAQFSCDEWGAWVLHLLQESDWSFGTCRC
jgi:hypothetical protein